jgi:hypothetical protein
VSNRQQLSFIDIFAICIMSGAPRAKEGSGAALATRFAPTHGANYRTPQPCEIGRSALEAPTPKNANAEAFASENE